MFRVRELVHLGLCLTGLPLMGVSALPGSLSHGSPGSSNGHGDSGSETPCSALTSAIRNDVVAAASGALYITLREAHWSQTAWESPSCIFTPQSANELVSGFKILTKVNASFAVRGGGHSPMPGWANINSPGVLISMTDINDLEYDPKSQTVRVGTGNRWGEVYSYLETFGRLVVGGRAPTVGLGLLTGGGLSHLSNKYGFASDNVVSYELLQADGNLETVTAKSNADLFYALKAGSNNFGILTHVTLRTYPVGKVWGGTLIYTNDHRDEIMQAFSSYQQSGQLDTNSALLSYMGINNDTLYVTLVYFGDVNRPAAFQPFYDVAAVFDGTVLHDNLTDLISQQIDLVVPRWTWAATTFFHDEDTYVEVARIAQQATAGLAAINGGTMVLMPQPISRTMVTESQARGPNPMAANLEAKEQMWFCINVGWNLEADDGRIGALLLDAIAQIEALTKARGLHSPFLFANDAYFAQAPLEGYGEDALAKMRRARAAIDPTGVFQRNVAGGFKLGLDLR